MSTFDARFDQVMGIVDQSGKCLGQDRTEWREFLRYAAAYFQARGIDRPVVVEIGTLDGAQKQFYEVLLSAEHIGISLPQTESASADIVGDSTKPGTLAALGDRLAGRSIDLLFIDGNHSIGYVKADLANYGPLTAHLIALHDLYGDDGTPGMDVGKAWEMVRAKYPGGPAQPFLTFHHQRRFEATSIWPGHEMGIGLVVKGGAL